MSDPVTQCTCGSRTFLRLTPTRGLWREYVVFDENGAENTEESESTTDDLVLGKPPKTMRCAECKKRYPNPDY